MIRSGNVVAALAAINRWRAPPIKINVRHRDLHFPCGGFSLCGLVTIAKERSKGTAQRHDDIVMPRETLPRYISQLARSWNGITGGTQRVQRSLPNPIRES